MLFFLANSAWEGVLSVLMPKTLVPESSNFAIPAWYAVNSLVQPPVNAAGKKARTTGFFPFRSARVTLPPAVDGSVKLGAVSPTFSGVASGACCAKSGASAAAARAAYFGSLMSYSLPFAGFSYLL